MDDNINTEVLNNNISSIITQTEIPIDNVINKYLNIQKQFFEYINWECLDYVPYFTLENVRNILSNINGNDFENELDLLSLNVNDFLGDKILKIINNFNPTVRVPKNYRNMRNRINAKLNNLFPINVISIQ